MEGRVISTLIELILIALIFSYIIWVLASSPCFRVVLFLALFRHSVDMKL